MQGTLEGDLTMAIRPEKIFVADKPDEIRDPDSAVVIKGKVGEVAYYGSFSNIFFEIGDGKRLLADIGNISRDIEEFTFSPGEEYWLYWRKDDALLLTD